MFNVSEIEYRVHKKITYSELGAIVLAILLTFYLLNFANFGNTVDYNHYLAAVEGDFQQFFYGYWLLPLLYPFAKLPFLPGYLLWTLLNIMGVWFAARVFNGNSTLALISYQAFSVFYFGQITGILCGVLALFWWGLNRNKVWLGGLALFIAIGKPQTGGLLAALLWLFASVPWKQKLRFLIIPCLGIFITTMIYPAWVMDIWGRLGNVIAWSNISLRQWIGSWGLLLYLPVVCLKMDREKRFLMAAVASICNLPYFLQQDLLILLIFPVGWLPILLGYIPAILFVFYEFAGHPSGIILALYVYVYNLVGSLSVLWRNKISP